MARRSTSTSLRRTRATMAGSKVAGAKSAPRPRRSPRARGRVRVVRSRSTGARKPTRPLPAPEPLGERLFLGSLERSLRDHRALWEALARR